MRGGILIVVSAIHGVVGYFTRKIREILLGKPYVIKYGYDALCHLTSVNQDGSLQSRYTFDPMGNRLTSRTSSDTTEYGHDACDEMNYAGDISYRYDMKGRLISEYDSTDNTERTYNWSYDDRLLYINYPDSTKSSMRYDYKGLRTYRKDNAGDITNYYWSLSSLPHVINETDGSGNSKASYILGTGLIAIKVSGVKKYYITDALGSVLALTDSSGNVTDTYEYNEYGELTASTGSSYNPYRFTGQQWDEDSELYYMGARFYNQGTGRFTQRDHILGISRQPQTFNRYVYANNNPILKIDPNGRVAIISPPGSAPIINTAINDLVSAINMNPPCRQMFEILGCGDIESILSNDSPPPTITINRALEYTGDYGGHTWGTDIIDLNPEYCMSNSDTSFLAQIIAHEFAHWCADRRLNEPEQSEEPPEGYCIEETCFGGGWA